MRSLLIVLVLSALAACGATDVGSVTLEGGKFVFHKGTVVPGAIAKGSYTDQDENAKESGFGHLSIKTTAVAGSTELDQFRAMGYLEGAMTQRRMAEHYTNMRAWIDGNFADGVVPASFEAWFKTQDAWVHEQAAANPASARWRAAAGATAQLEGLVDGYNAEAPEAERRSLYDWQLIQATGDLFDLIPTILPSQAPDWERMPLDKLMDEVRANSHCSALIRLTGNLSDVLMSHVAWFSYGSMLRVYKTYDVDAVFPGRRTAFSSYPGLLSSLDDFYLNSPSQLGMVQTTNNVFNKSLYQFVKPQSLFAWQRVRAANLAADAGEDWVDIIRADNSGTYNNAYMTVDFKRFEVGKPLPEGTLWYSEQIPGLVMGADVTDYLVKGYWASYNVPYFKEIYDRSGYPEVKARAEAEQALEQVAGLDYQLAPRSQIFRRDAFKADDLASLAVVMRTNDYRTDPYAKGDPWAAVCSRGDLASRPSAGGCYDGKATTASMARELRAIVVNGPTTSGGTLPPFRWTPAFNTTRHVGQFDEFDFKWQEMAPADL